MVHTTRGTQPARLMNKVTCWVSPRVSIGENSLNAWKCIGSRTVASYVPSSLRTMRACCGASWRRRLVQEDARAKELVGLDVLRPSSASCSGFAGVLRRTISSGAALIPSSSTSQTTSQ